MNKQHMLGGLVQAEGVILGFREQFVRNNHLHYDDAADMGPLRGPEAEQGMIFALTSLIAHARHYHRMSWWRIVHAALLARHVTVRYP